MKIRIVGKGFVGNAISEGFKTQGHEIVAHDIRLETKIEDVLDTPIVYIAVPTPSARRNLFVFGVSENFFQQNQKLGGCFFGEVKATFLGSCFHKATKLSKKHSKAVP